MDDQDRLIPEGLFDLPPATDTTASSQATAISRPSAPLPSHYSLSTLPILVLRNILLHLDSPWKLLQTCKTLHQLWSNNAALRVEWHVLHPQLTSRWYRSILDNRSVERQWASLFDQRFCAAALRYIRRRHHALEQSLSKAQKRDISHVRQASTTSTTAGGEAPGDIKEGAKDSAFPFDPCLLGAVFAHAALSGWVPIVKETLQLNDLFYRCTAELDCLHPESEDIDDEEEPTVLYNLVEAVASNAEVSSPEVLGVFLEADHRFVAACRQVGAGDGDSVLILTRADYWRWILRTCIESAESQLNTVIFGSEGEDERRKRKWNNTLAKLRVCVEWAVGANATLRATQAVEKWNRFDYYVPENTHVEPLFEINLSNRPPGADDGDLDGYESESDGFGMTTAKKHRSLDSIVANVADALKTLIPIIPNPHSERPLMPLILRYSSLDTKGFIPILDHALRKGDIELLSFFVHNVAYTPSAFLASAIHRAHGNVNVAEWVWMMTGSVSTDGGYDILDVGKFYQLIVHQGLREKGRDGSMSESAVLRMRVMEACLGCGKEGGDEHEPLKVWSHDDGMVSNSRHGSPEAYLLKKAYRSLESAALMVKKFAIQGLPAAVKLVIPAVENLLLTSSWSQDEKSSEEITSEEDQADSSSPSTPRRVMEDILNHATTSTNNPWHTSNTPHD
ncbi:hypothetical protein HK102_007954, partial [Quaeritorhiza haematococci]